MGATKDGGWLLESNENVFKGALKEIDRIAKEEDKKRKDKKNG